MELFSHLGLVSGPALSLRSLWLKAWAVAVVLVLTDLVLYYYTFVAVFAVLALVTPSWADKGSEFIVDTYWHAVAFFVRWNNVKVVVRGDAICGESALVICNHQSLVDYYVLYYLSQTGQSAKSSHIPRPFRLFCPPRVNFFTWYSVWRVPSARTLLNVLFCDENWQLSKLLCHAMFRPVVAREPPQWVVVFPEVNIWTPAAAYLQRLQAKQYFLPCYNHTLYPRYSGVMNAVHVLNCASNVKFFKAYNVTILYRCQRWPTLLDLFALSKRIVVVIDVKVMSLDCIPTKRAKLEKWLEKTWCEKDRFLGSMCSGKEPGTKPGTKPGTEPDQKPAPGPSPEPAPPSPIPFWDIPLGELWRAARP